MFGEQQQMLGVLPQGLPPRSACPFPRGYLPCCTNTFLLTTCKCGFAGGNWSCPAIDVPPLPAANSPAPLHQGKAGQILWCHSHSRAPLGIRLKLDVI